MKVTGGRRWLVLGLTCILAGIMVYVPFLRYSYMEQMITVFTKYKPIVPSSYAYEYIGDIGFAYGIIVMFSYLFGGVIADKFSEKYLLLAGSILMGCASIWYGTVPGRLEIIIIHVIYAVGTGILIWSAYLKVTRKMGNKEEQGRMFAISEMARSVLNMLIGFLGVSMLGKAVLNSGVADPELLGSQWRNLLFLCGFAHIAIGIIVFLVLPKEIIGNEAEDNEVVQKQIGIKTILEVLKLPGVWLVSLLIFFCFSFYSAGSGYLGSYTINVLGITETQASSYSVIRTYIIAAISTLAIGFIADKIGSKVKTLGFYLAIATIVVVVMIFSEGSVTLSIGISFLYAFFYTGMRGIYFATMSEVGIPLSLTGAATGVISFLCYLPDVYFAKMAGGWIDAYGNVGYRYIWYWSIGCGILGILVSFITSKYVKKLSTDQKVQ